MRIGPLRHRVTIQEETVSADLMNGGSVSWAAISTNPTVWAQVTPLRGTERVAAQQLAERVDYEVYLRYRTDLSEKYRLTWGDETLQIRAILPDNKRAFVRLLCQGGGGIAH